MLIRLMQESDIPQACALEPLIFPKEPSWRPVDFEREMSHGKSFVLVEESTNQLIGYLMCTPYKDKKFNISNFGIVPEFRKLGLGTSMLKHLIHTIRSDYHYSEELSISLTVKNKNRLAMKLYESLGFTYTMWGHTHNDMCLYTTGLQSKWDLAPAEEVQIGSSPFEFGMPAIKLTAREPIRTAYSPEFFQPSSNVASSAGTSPFSYGLDILSSQL